MGTFSVTLEVSGVSFTLDPSSSSSSFAVQEADVENICIDLKNFSGRLLVAARSTSSRDTDNNNATIPKGSALERTEPPLGVTDKSPASSGILRCGTESRFSSSSESAVHVAATPSSSGGHDGHDAKNEAKVRDIIECWSSEVGKSNPTSTDSGNQAPEASRSSVSFDAMPLHNGSTNTGTSTSSRSHESRRGGIIAQTDSERASAFLTHDDEETDDTRDKDLDRGYGESRRGGIIAKTDSERASALDNDPETGNNTKEEEGTAESSSTSSRLKMSSSTRLHITCARPRVGVRELQGVLRNNLSLASKRDPFGRYPLHVIAENEALAASVPIEDLALFVKELLDANPRAILAKDIEGQLPFVATIADWVDSVYVPPEDGIEASYHGLASSLSTPSERGRQFDEASPSLRIFTYAFPRDVVIPQHVAFSFKMLSISIDHLTPAPGTPPWRCRTIADIRSSMAEQTASSIPFLCKTLLLVSDEDEADAIYDSSILRTVMLYPDVIGFWLVATIRSKRSRVVDFLEQLSKVSVGDFVGRKRGFTKDEIDDFVAKRKRVFDAVANLEGLVPSMLALNASMIERAASTRVITFALDQAMKNPICLGFMLFDLILEIILVITYRIYVDGENLVADVVKGCGSISLAISAYFLLRDALTAICMIATSRTMFTQFLRDFWTINDILSVSLTFISCLCKFNGINAPALFAFTIGFIWLKVLGTLKSLNMHLATFILALVEIVKDSRWFLLILGLAIIMFADMIEIISKNSGLCGGVEQATFEEGRRRLDPQDDFCSPYILDSYARIYAVLVGDVTLEDFQQSGWITLLFVFFTFFGILILLSVLIAIVEDSYSRAKIRSFALFGRARVEFVARQQIRERFLKPEEERAPCCSQEHLKQLLRRCIRWGVALTVIAVAVTVGILLALTIYAVFYEYRNYDNIRYLDLTLVVVAILFAASLLSLLALFLKQYQRDNFIFRTFSAVGIIPLTAFCHFLGIDREGQSMRDAESTLDDQWVSKIFYMEKRTKAIVESSESRILAEMNKDIKDSEEHLIAQGRHNLLELEEEMTKMAEVASLARSA